MLFSALFNFILFMRTAEETQLSKSSMFAIIAM